MKNTHNLLRWAFAFLIASWNIVLIGCKDDPKPVAEDDLAVDSRLLQFSTCDQVEAHIKTTAEADMRRYIQLARQSVLSSSQGVPNYDYSAVGAAPPMASSTVGAPEAKDSATRTPKHSETNNQEVGVDEADIVKTDGNFIYVLSNGKLVILSSVANADKKALTKVSELDLGGNGFEMLVKENQAVVFLNVWSIGYPEPLKANPALASMTCAAMCTPYFCGCGSSATQIALIDISDRTKPKMKRSWTGSFSYASSRLVDDAVRIVVSDAVRGPVYKTWPDNVNTPAPWGSDEHKRTFLQALDALEKENLETIRKAEITELIPEVVQTVYHDDGSRTETVDPLAGCDAFYRSGRTDGLNILDVATLNLAKPESLQHAAVLGHAGIVYASTDNLYVATHPWFSRAWWGWADDGLAREERTKIHKFDIKSDPTRAVYRATGVVPGFVLNQFSMDDTAQTLRVGTTINNRMGWMTDAVASSGGGTGSAGSGAIDVSAPPVANVVNGFQVQKLTADLCSSRSSNHMFTLQERSIRGQSVLSVRSAVRNLACGETIKSMRYVGDTGYMVTFETKDPLYIFDLKDAHNIQMLSQLTVTGFSSYMHPLDDNHLLTIGRETTLSGVDTGLALSIFDVSDKAAPKLTHRLVTSQAVSEAEYEHKAFSFFPDQKLLAIPLDKISYDSWTNNTMGLSLFSVDVNEGIRALNTIAHLSSTCYGAPTDVNTKPPYVAHAWPVSVRRSLTIENHLYSISTMAVMATPLSELTKVDGEVCLPEVPFVDNMYRFD